MAQSYNTAAAQVVSYTATSAASGAAIGAGGVRLCATSACWVRFGASPTAEAAALNFLLPANTPIELACKATDKVAAIRDAADGKLSVLPIA